jgi:ABC-type polysaccharide/polyol phosphate transport system ATPase subunit
MDRAAVSTSPNLATAAAPVQRSTAIEVEGLSASYRVRLDAPTLRADLRRLVSGRRDNVRIVPALRDVSFTVPRGSVLAVVGRNGAGKSTLLRVLCGILAPEAGRVVVRGRLNLLRPGLGMNNNLTGRQNIRLGGLAVGIAADRLDELTDVIAEFAQLDEYIDFPIRTYSSGMRMRLGVAVAAHLDPEILLIDEALTGGDAAFQAHVAQRMADLCGEGRTIVLVTHGLSSVKRMATEALWLHQGEVAAWGAPDDVVARYMRYCRLESLDMELGDG